MMSMDRGICLRLRSSSIGNEVEKKEPGNQQGRDGFNGYDRPVSIYAPDNSSSCQPPKVPRLPGVLGFNSKVDRIYLVTLGNIRLASVRRSIRMSHITY